MSKLSSMAVGDFQENQEGSFHQEQVEKCLNIFHCQKNEFKRFLKFHIFLKDIKERHSRKT